MKFFDQFGKAASHAVDRAKFEAEKFHKTSRIQGELNEIQEQLNEKLIELGQRTYDLYRASQLTMPSVADLIKAIDLLRIEVIKKEDELRQAQAEIYVEPEGETAARSVPIQDEPGAQSAASGQPAPSGGPPPDQQQPAADEGTRTCPACSFQMPARAVFCPNCGFRLGS
jgi:hypothetical protein